MKKVHLAASVKSNVYLLLFLFFASGLFAQNQNQLKNLVELAENLRVEQQLKKREAIRRAEVLGLPMRVELENGRIIELMAFENDQPFYYTTFNVNAAKTISTNHLHAGGSTGYNLSGSTDTLGIWDGGAVRSTHDEFFAGQVIDGDGGSLSNHGTHVGGTMVANGFVASAKGMAPDAHLISYDWNSDDAEIAAMAAAGMNISNHSYGFVRGWDNGSGSWVWYGNSSVSTTEDYLFGFYDYYAAVMDQLLNNAPYYLHVKSAGNDRNDVDPAAGVGDPEQDGGVDGYDCISHVGISKNVLTVGAVGDITSGYSAPGDVVMSSFSGWGPADDGRIKPDIVGNGIGLYSSTAGSDSQYGNYSGTSMASPSIAGSLGLLLEQQRNYYGDVVFRASTLKGLLLHTADEAGLYDGPDYIFGWGLANLRTAAELIEEAADHCLNIAEYNLSNGEVIEFPVVKEAGSPLKVTIAWNDPYGLPVSASLDPTNKMLVNDLDLRLITADSTVSYPWTLDPSNPSAAATTGDNNTDNIEQVVIDDGSENMYTVRISHKGTLLSSADQVVSVIISGNKSLGTVGLVSVSHDTVTTEKAYWAHQFLQTDSTSFLIQSGGDVTFTSGEKITLYPGFHAGSGSLFHAYLNTNLDCSTGTFTLRDGTAPVQGRFVFEKNTLDGGLRGNIPPRAQNELLEPISSQNLSFDVYPNPSEGLFQVAFRDESPKHIEVFDLDGTLLKSVMGSEKTASINLDLRAYPKGVYWLKVTFSETIQTAKIIIQ